MTSSVAKPLPWALDAGHDEDLALRDRLAQGDAGAVALAYDTHRERVRAFAQRLLGDAALAEDLVHDTFVALPRAAQRFDGRRPLASLLLGIAANQAKHYVRSAKRRRAAVARLDAQPPAPPSPTPESTAARRELAAHLARALDALPVAQRVAFVLCDVEEHTSTEAARILGVPEGTVRTRLMHARRKLRRTLEREARHG